MRSANFPGSGSLRVHIQLPLISAAAIGMRFHGSLTNRKASTQLTANATVAAHLPRLVIARRSRQLMMLDQPGFQAWRAVGKTESRQNDEGHRGQQRQYDADAAEPERNKSRCQIELPFHPVALSRIDANADSVHALSCDKQIPAVADRADLVRWGSARISGRSHWRRQRSPSQETKSQQPRNQRPAHHAELDRFDLLRFSKGKVADKQAHGETDAGQTG